MPRGVPLRRRNRGPGVRIVQPHGARPLGNATLGAGAYLEGAGASNNRPRDLLEDGTLFFNSSDALVPHASDGLQNVYEYENGHIYPISNVAGGFESFFLDASADGRTSSSAPQTSSCPRTLQQRGGLRRAGRRRLPRPRGGSVLR